MTTGGRVMHHSKAFAPDERNLVLFAGHQAAGTGGATPVCGADAVKIPGQWVPVRAEISQLQALTEVTVPEHGESVRLETREAPRR